MNLNSYDTIILDCDGVIFDSNLLKIDAFKKTLNDFDTKSIEMFTNYFRENFGTSRFNLVKYFILDILKIDFDEHLYHVILNSYGENCILLYQQASLTDYFLCFIDRYKAKNIFVASGSDENELRQVFKFRDIEKHFLNIFGSPRAKSEIVKEIVHVYSNAVMIGDAKSDLLAAKDNGIDFIFMRDYSTNEAMKKDKTLKSINNLGDLIL